MKNVIRTKKDERQNQPTQNIILPTAALVIPEKDPFQPRPETIHCQTSLFAMPPETGASYSDTINPSRISIIRSACFAASGLWVIIIIV
jgi:hypothetical protein